MTPFQDAKPFPHYVLPDSVFRRHLERINHEWPEASSPNWREYRDNKFAIHDFADLSASARELIDSCNSPQMLRYIGWITGIPGLIADIELNGAGLHEVRPGGKLDMHVDFNRLGGLYRRLNLLIYLNPVWEEEWGGCLYLGKNRDVKVVPTLGTAVLFATSNDSWHGHPDPIVGPKPRRSIALYYYTTDPPPDYRGELETTLYEDKNA